MSLAKVFLISDVTECIIEDEEAWRKSTAFAAGNINSSNYPIIIENLKQHVRIAAIDANEHYPRGIHTIEILGPARVLFNVHGMIVSGDAGLAYARGTLTVTYTGDQPGNVLMANVGDSLHVYKFKEDQIKHIRAQDAQLTVHSFRTMASFPNFHLNNTQVNVVLTQTDTEEKVTRESLYVEAENGSTFRMHTPMVTDLVFDIIGNSIAQFRLRQPNIDDVEYGGRAKLEITGNITQHSDVTVETGTRTSRRTFARNIFIEDKSIDGFEQEGGCTLLVNSEPCPPESFSHEVIMTELHI